MIRRALALLVTLGLLAPSAAAAQQSRAGVVTTLEGSVSARRVALPGPVPLKFRDDVFLQDTVTTGDKSLARMLLGGKAVVTVRERSILTITEIPGRSTIELETGKFSLAVAREKMRPGEEIQIRTPNAIAGVRGTVVITEVHRRSAQAGGGGPAVVTNFFVLRGSITAQPLDPASRQPLGTPLPVATMQSYSGAGTAPPTIGPVAPEQIGRITAGLQPQGPKAGTDVGQAQVKAQQVQTAVSLLTALTGGGAALYTPPVPLPQPTVAALEQSPTVVPITPTRDAVETFMAQAPTLGQLPQFQTVAGVVTLTGAATAFTTSFTSTTPSPLFLLTNATITQVGAGVDFITLASGATVSVAGPLVTFVDSALLTPGSLFEMLNAAFASSAATALFDLDPSTISAGEALIVLNGGTFSLAGPLLADVGGTLTAANELLRLQGGVAFTGTGSAALIQLSGTTAATGRGAAVLGSSMSLAGPFLSASSTSFRTGDPTANTLSFLFIGDGGGVSSTSTDPFLRFTDSSLDTAGDVLTIRRSTASTPSRLTLAGPLLDATNSTFNHTSLGFAAAFGTSPSACCSGFFVAQGGQLVSSTTQALIKLTGSTFTGLDGQSGGGFFTIADTFAGAPSAELTAPASVSLAGPLLQSVNTTITSLFHLLRVQRSSLTSTSVSPLIDITGGSVTLGGTNAIGGTGVGNLLSLIASSASGDPGSSASVSLGGPLARLTGVTFDAGAGNIVTVANGATLASSGPGALLHLTNGTLTGFNLLSVSGVGGTSGASAASVTLAGPLLATSGAALTLGRNLLFTGGSFTATGTGALVQLSGGSLKTGTSSTDGAVLQISGVSPGLVTLAGPVLSTASGASLTAAGPLLSTFLGGRLVVNSSTSPLYAFTGDTHSFGTTSDANGNAAFLLNGLSTDTAVEGVQVEIDSGMCDGPCPSQTQNVTVGTREPVRHGGALLDATGGTLSTNKVLSLDTALLAATAPIIDLRSSASLTVAGDALDLVKNAKLTASDVNNPLIRLNASTLTVSSGALLAVRTSSFLNVAGNAIQLSGGAVINVSNGPLLLVSGNSVVKIAGALVNFGTGGGTVNITNSLCPSECGVFGPFKVSFANGASSQNVVIGNGAKTGSGTVNVNLQGAHIRVEGANSRVNISTDSRSQ